MRTSTRRLKQLNPILHKSLHFLSKRVVLTLLSLFVVRCFALAWQLLPISLSFLPKCCSNATIIVDLFGLGGFQYVMRSLGIRVYSLLSDFLTVHFRYVFFVLCLALIHGKCSMPHATLGLIVLSLLLSQNNGSFRYVKWKLKHLILPIQFRIIVTCASVHSLDGRVINPKPYLPELSTLHNIEYSNTIIKNQRRGQSTTVDHRLIDRSRKFFSSFAHLLPASVVPSLVWNVQWKW